MKILIIKTAALGDVLRTTVILEGLMDKYVNPKIYWLCNYDAKPLIENNQFIEKIFYNEELSQNNNNNIFEQEYNLVISLEEDKELLKKLKDIKKEKIFGVYLDSNNELKYTDDSAAWYNMSLISKFGKNVADEIKKSNINSYPEMLYKMLNLNWNKQRYKLFLIKKELNYFQDLKKELNKDLPLIGIVLSAGNKWPMKSLPSDKLIELINLINNKYNDKIQILCLTGPTKLELDRVDEIKRSCSFILTHNVQDISEFIGIVNLCDVIISPDTLSMHIAISLNKYTISYFTVTSAAEIEIYNGEKIIAKHPDYCSYNKENKNRPNITDSINITEIIDTLNTILKMHRGYK